MINTDITYLLSEIKELNESEIIYLSGIVDALKHCRAKIKEAENSLEKTD